MRKYCIDYLRLFGILLLFPFHAARVFDPYEANYIQSSVKSYAGVQFMATIWPWFMPLMFLVAGIATWFALQKRSGKQFVNERIFRLLIPLLIGLILIVPIQGYFARMQQGTLNGGYFKFLFTQFFVDFSDLSGYFGSFTPAHLWFILYLFIYSLAFLSLFIHIRNSINRNKQSVLKKLFQNKWFLLLLFIPITISEALPDIGGKNPFFYASFYFIGFGFAAYNSWDLIKNIKYPALITMVISLPLYFFLLKVAFGKDDFAWQSILFAFIRNLYGICTLFVMIAFGDKYLNRGGKVLKYLNQAAFPIYILHQSIMMVIAYFVVQWRIKIGLQFSIIAILTLVASFAIFEVSRHFVLTRIILGIK